MNMSEIYSRSPIFAWLLAAAMLGLGLLWLIPRFGRDLNLILGYRAVKVGFFATIIWLLFGVHFILTTAIISARSHGVDFHSGEGAGLIAARQVIDLAWLLSLVFGIRAIHFHSTRALGEQTGLLTPAFIVGLTIALLASVPYLQNRLNQLAQASHDGEGASE